MRISDWSSDVCSSDLVASPARFRWSPNSMAWCCICQNFSTEQYAMHMTFDGSGGISIAASLVGDGLGRPPVLLAHGGGQTRRTWRKTMQQLAQHGYRSLAIDMLGHGESDWADPDQYRFADFAKDILAVCDRLIGRASGREKGCK